MMKMNANLLISLTCVSAFYVGSVNAGVVVGDADEAKTLPEIQQVTPAPIRPPLSPVKAKQAKKNPSVDEIDEIAAADAKKRKKYVMRCWQNGQLILERQMDDLPPDSSKTVALDGGRGMRLFDLRNAACLLQ
jgi:hypothetical protein